jgi:uncharacterized membrane protein YraQ (UPF0718 family)
MLIIHYITVYTVVTRVGTTTIITKNRTSTISTNTVVILDVLDRLDRSNQTLFNILLPVFGAWVGVVVAFYFGSKQAKKAQEALTEQTKRGHDLLFKALSREDQRLANITVEQALNQYPNARKVSIVDLKDTLTNVLESFGDFSNVVVLDKLECLEYYTNHNC